MNEKEIERMLFDTQKEYTRSNKIKDKIIILLIVLMFLEAVVFFSGFLWYENQFVVTTDLCDKTEVTTEGENASINYSNVEGNQYNDNATHNSK